MYQKLPPPTMAYGYIPLAYGDSILSEKVKWYDFEYQPWMEIC